MICLLNDHRRLVKLVRLTCTLILLQIGNSNAQDSSEDYHWSKDQKWENSTAYTKTYVVDQKHPNSSDSNIGSPDRPLKSIGRATELVKAGERVLVYEGVYRETISPMTGGKSKSKMISFETAPGAEVIVKGSKVLKAKWEQHKIYTDVLRDSSLSHTWSRKVWVTTVPDTFFVNGYYPFKSPNITPQEHKLMPWAKLVKNRSPYTSTRGLLFQNGKRMVQLEDYGDLTHVPGSFWIDADGKTVHIHSFDSGNPNRSVIEVAVRSHLFKPKQIGLNYIQVRGFTFEHCANGFLRTSTGAVTTLGGQHWIIEGNTIRHVNSSGLEFGFMAFEKDDPNPENKIRDAGNDMGSMIVRNNTIYDCGTAGIRSFMVTNGIIENNHIHHIGWQDAENYWECSGIKMLVAHNTLVSNNHIHNIQGGNGIWLDWDIRYSRVSKNVIYDVQNIQGGIFIEASHYPNLVDNNVVWNIDGNGIYANDTDYLMVYHNLVGKITGNAVHAIVQTDRYQNGRNLTAEENRVFNNIFVDTKPMRFSSTSNLVDHNVYIVTEHPDYIDLNELVSKGLDVNSVKIYGDMALNSDALFLFWMGNPLLQEVPRLPEVSHDFFNQPREGVFPGPFDLLDKTIIHLKEH